MASSSTVAIVAVLAAAVAGGAGYYLGQQPGGSIGGGGGSMAAPAMSSAGAPAVKSPIVVKVNGEPIYQSEVDSVIRDLGDRASQIPPADLQSRIVDRLIDSRLADQKAAASKFGDDPTVADKLRRGQMDILAEAYVEHIARSKITDDLLKSKYDELAKQAPPTEEVHARHILVKTEAEAKDIIKQLDKGASFEDLAKSKSTDPGSGASGGDLGYFTKDKMVPEFADAAFKLDKGKYSETPVHSQFGWHVIQVIDKRSQPLPTLDQVKGQLTNIVLQDEERKAMEDLHKGAKIERFNPDGSPVVETPPAPAAAAPTVGVTPAPVAPPAPAGQGAATK